MTWKLGLMCSPPLQWMKSALCRQKQTAQIKCTKCKNALRGLLAGNTFKNCGDEGIYAALQMHYPVGNNHAEGESKMD
eukprot:2391910-Ditylum_brightwellii.AAC.1